MTLVQESLDRAVPIDRDNLIWDVLKGGEQMVDCSSQTECWNFHRTRNFRNVRVSILLDAARKGQLRLAKCLVDRHFKIPVRKASELPFTGICCM